MLTLGVAQVHILQQLGKYPDVAFDLRIATLANVLAVPRCNAFETVDSSELYVCPEQVLTE